MVKHVDLHTLEAFHLTQLSRPFIFELIICYTRKYLHEVRNFFNPQFCLMSHIEEPKK